MKNLFRKNEIQNKIKKMINKNTMRRQQSKLVYCGRPDLSNIYVTNRMYLVSEDEPKKTMIFFFKSKFCQINFVPHNHYTWPN